MVTSLSSELWTMKCVQPPLVRSVVTFTAVRSVETAPKIGGEGWKQNTPAELMRSARMLRFNFEFNFSGLIVSIPGQPEAGGMRALPEIFRLPWAALWYACARAAARA